MSGKGGIKFSMRVDGLSELLENLERLSRAVSRRLQREGLTEAAEPMRRAMSAHAPRRSGRLAEDMTISPARGQDEEEVAVAVGPSQDAYYGGLQEFGVAHAPAQPFARPGFDESIDEALAIFAAAIWRELAGRGIARSVSAPTTPSSPSGGGGLV